MNSCTHKFRQGALLALVPWLVLLSLILPSFAGEAPAAKRDAALRLYEKYRKKFPEVQEIAPRRAMELYSRGTAIFVDVRTKQEQSVSTLPGAISDEEFKKNPKAFSDRIVIAYCTVGYRSARLASKMAKEGIPVFNLAGGMLLWAWDGGALVSDGAPTKKMHVYGRKWSFLPDDFEAVW